MNPFGFDSIERKVSDLERQLTQKAWDEDVTRASNRITVLQDEVSSLRSSVEIRLQSMEQRHEELVQRIEYLELKSRITPDP